MSREELDGMLGPAESTGADVNMDESDEYRRERTESLSSCSTSNDDLFANKSTVSN